jgi:hypothetical protein
MAIDEIKGTSPSVPGTIREMTRRRDRTFWHFLDEGKDFARTLGMVLLSLVILFPFRELSTIPVWPDLTVHSATKIFQDPERISISIEPTAVRIWESEYFPVFGWEIHVQLNLQLLSTVSRHEGTDHLGVQRIFKYSLPYLSVFPLSKLLPELRLSLRLDLKRYHPAPDSG